MSIFILKTAFLYFIFNLLHKTGVQHLLQLFSSGFFSTLAGKGLLLYFLPKFPTIIRSQCFSSFLIVLQEA